MGQLIFNFFIRFIFESKKDSKERQREALLEYIANLSQSKNIQLQQQQQQSQSEAFVHPASVHPYFKMPGYNENVSPQVIEYQILNFSYLKTVKMNCALIKKKQSFIKKID